MRPTFASVPALFADAGRDAVRRFIEFFTANIRQSQHESCLNPRCCPIRPLV